MNKILKNEQIKSNLTKSFTKTRFLLAFMLKLIFNKMKPL